MPIAADANELLQALAVAKPGEVILLAAGDWGEVTIRNARFASPVLLRSADADRPARFRRITIRDVRSLTLEDIEIAHRLAPGEADHAAALRIDRSEDVTLRGARVHGSPDGNHTNDGMGVVALDSRRIRIEACRFHDLKTATSIGRAVGVVVRGNEYRDLRSDGINVANASDVLVEGNRMTRFHTAQHLGDHPDFIQMWNDGQSGPMRDIVIRANTLRQGDGDPVQGIFVEGSITRERHASNRPTTTGLRIENNTIETGAAQGIWVFDAEAVSITGNTVTAPAAARLVPSIRNERRRR